MDPVALAWYCIDIIIDAIHELSSVILATGDSKAIAESHLHRLHLALIATVHSLPLPLILGVLDKIRDIIIEEDYRIEHHERSKAGASAGEGGNTAPGHKTELVNALFSEILEHVGDREKEAAMGWWYANLAELKGAVRDGDGIQGSSDLDLGKEAHIPDQ
jgi:hypothetical protein